MKSETPLSDMYLLYMKGELQKHDFEGRIFKYLLDNFECYRGFYGNRDYWNEFISWLYPRFSRAIDLYRDIGATFDAYITGTIKGAAKEYRCREAERKLTEYVCWQARAMEVHDKEPEYEPGRIEEQDDFSIPKEISPRQILMLLLKSYYFVSDEFVDHVALAIGMDTRVVRGFIEELRRRQKGKEERILDLKERLYCQHYRCLAYQKRMEKALPGTEYHERMKKTFELARKRFYSIKKRLDGIRLSAPNRMIADVLGIPRGTVDSGLYAVKTRLVSDDNMG